MSGICLKDFGQKKGGGENEDETRVTMFEILESRQQVYVLYNSLQF